VVLYELMREWKPNQGRELSAMASAGDRERLVALLVEALERSAGGGQPSGPTAEERVRRLIRPMVLTEEEAHGWMGVVRKVLWKLKGED
jgi:tRNA C32,U32 (ribose-2'-O)-methylase TrmJ